MKYLTWDTHRTLMNPCMAATVSLKPKNTKSIWSQSMQSQRMCKMTCVTWNFWKLASWRAKKNTSL